MSAGAMGMMVAKARHKVRRAFENAEAYSPERAIGFEPQHRLERRWLDRMIDAGSIVEAEPGAFWMDREKYAAEERRRRIRTLAMVGTAVGATLALFGISQL